MLKYFLQDVCCSWYSIKIGSRSSSPCLRHLQKQHQITLYTFPARPSGLYETIFDDKKCTIAIVNNHGRTSRQTGMAITLMPCLALK